jgi:adenosylmethionine-8-amino-7-oxononanoate aminotransferase
MAKRGIRVTANVFVGAEKAFAAYGKETAALIVEPILQGAAGMRIYPPEYLRRLRQLCDQYGVLLIDDEVAAGFGRTGKMFAIEHAGVSPDILCTSKGLTGGYLPMSLTITTDAIYQAFYDDFKTHKAFVHSHTYAGNPPGLPGGPGCATHHGTRRYIKKSCRKEHLPSRKVRRCSRQPQPCRRNPPHRPDQCD